MVCGGVTLGTLLQLHPYLFAGYTSLALLAANLGQVRTGAAARAILAALVLCTVLLYTLRLLFPPERAALLASGVILLASSYGHVTRMASTILPASFAAIAIAVIWIVALASWARLVTKRLEDPKPVGQYFLAVGLILIVMPIYSLWNYSSSKELTDDWLVSYRSQIAIEQGLPAAPAEGNPGTAPDIYYLVFDAYSRADVLDEIFAYNNRPFLAELERRGFYVADASTSNYASTELSLASTLNMVHLDGLPTALAEDGLRTDEETVLLAAAGLVGDSYFVDTVQAQGYTIVAFDGGYAPAYLDEPDRLLHHPGLDEESLWRVGFEVMLLDTTLGRTASRLLRDVYAPLQGLFEAHRTRVLYTMETLPETPNSSGPQFVYAHVVSPHVPYVFGRDGERVHSDDPYTLLNARPGAEDNLVKYRDQLHYLNGLILQAIDGILANSDEPPVIILQGDHGAKVYSGPNPPPSIRRQLRFPILNAYLLPGAEADWLRADISPVNSFRGVLNSYFGADLHFAPDNSYEFIRDERPVRFEPVCVAAANCP